MRYLITLESEALEWLLSGNDEVLHALRQQLASAIATSRDLTGYGFYLNFVLPENTEKLHERFRVKPDFCFGDVEATIDSLKYGVGFLLWVTDGLLSSLKCYTYDEKWPTVINSFQLHYFSGQVRDLENLKRNWMLVSSG